MKYTKKQESTSDIKFKIGSQVFFGNYPDYSPHDKDFIVFQDSPKLYKTFMNARGRGLDTFFYKKMSKQEFITYELEHCKKTPMAAGKLLVPALCDYFKITINDLKLFAEAFNSIDEKHNYEKVIYDSYIENNSFSLTDEQRDRAYKLYKEARK